MEGEPTDLDREWEMESRSLGGQMETLNVKYRILCEQIIADAPRFFRPLLRRVLLKSQKKEHTSDN